jgi:3-oxoadipate enol-lactonase
MPTDLFQTATLPTGPTVAYTDSGGGGDGPALLLSHGFLLDHRMFDAQVEALRDGWRVITWDERGHGATSGGDAAPYTFWDSAKDALALLTHLGIGRAVLGGMSQGGFLSLRAALLAPERVRALILIDTQAGVENPDAAPLYEAMHDQWVTEGPTDDLARTALSIVMGDDPALLDTWLPRALDRPKELLTAPFRCLMDRDDITARLGEIAVPALVIHGTSDSAIPQERGGQLVEGLPGARPLLLVEGGQHASNMTHPELVNAAIKDFLASI